MAIYKIRNSEVDAFEWTGKVEDAPEWFKTWYKENEGVCAGFDEEGFWIDESGGKGYPDSSPLSMYDSRTYVEKGDFIFFDAFIFNAVTSSPPSHFHEQYEKVPT